MKFDKETIIALVVCMVVIIAWPFASKLFSKDAVPAPRTEVAPVKAPEKNAAAPAVEKAAEKGLPKEKAPEVKALPAVSISNGNLALDISPELASIIKVTYLKHNTAKDGEKLVTRYRDFLGAFQLIGKNWQLIGQPTVVKNDAASCTISRKILTSQGEIVVAQKFSLKPDSYVVDCDYSFTAPGADKEVVLTDMSVYGAEIAPWHMVSGDKKRAVSHRIDYRTTYGENDDIASSKDDEDFFFVRPPEVFWAAVSNKYFCTVFKRDDVRKGGFIIKQHRRFVKVDGDKEEPIIAVGALLPPVKIAPGAAATMEFSTYDGPKDIDALGDFAGGAAGVMHLAWGPLNYLARFLLWILTFFHSLCNSWGVSIILLTILVRAVFYPITARGNESMKKMQNIQPKFKELREKYSDNPQLLNQKMAELYRAEGVNPFAGCLPILLQIPIFFALYAMLDNAIDLRHVSFLWCKNLAAADTIFSIPLGFELPFLKITAIPINPLVLAMTALMVIQQRMTPMSMDPAQKKMMAFMPVIMLLFLFDLPSGLTLYWTVSNLFSILQLWLQKRRGEKAAAAQPKTQGN